MPVIATNYAGLQTTIGDSGILVGSGVDSEAYTREFRVEFVEKCIEILKDRELWKKWSDRGKMNAAKHTWENAAKNLVSSLF